MTPGTLMNAERLLILGFGGHARSVADIALACGYEELLFLDANAKEGENFLDYPVVPRIDDLLYAEWSVFPAAGDNSVRQKQYRRICSLGRMPATLISPQASIGRGAIISPGCLVGHHAHVGPMSRIGEGCIINTGAIVEHESTVGDFSHVSVNATIAGRTRLGSLSMLGAGATIIDGLSVCDRVTIGAGAMVHRSIHVAGTYVGVPAKRVR